MKRSLIFLTLNQPLPIDPLNFAARARVPVLLQLGRTDWLSSPPDGQALLALIPHADRHLMFYDAGHQLPAAFLADAATWLIERLREPAADGSGRSERPTDSG